MIMWKLLLLMPSLCSFSWAAPAWIGYGSAVSTLTSKNQENIYMGFELGLKEVIGKDKTEKILVSRKIVTSSQLGAISVAQDLLNQKVHAVFGFSGSHDSLLAGKILGKANILTIFPGSNHNDISKLGKFVYTTGHSMSLEVSNTLSFLNKFFPGKKGAAIFNPQAAASDSIDKIMSNLLKQKHKPVYLFFLDKTLYINFH